jgi:hypothetical protein
MWRNTSKKCDTPIFDTLVSSKIRNRHIPYRISGRPMSPFGAYFVAHFVSHILSRHIPLRFLAHEIQLLVVHVQNVPWNTYLLSYFYWYPLGLDRSISRPWPIPYPLIYNLGLDMSFMVRHIVLIRVRGAHVYDDKSICGGSRVKTVSPSSHNVHLIAHCFLTSSTLYDFLKP